MADNPPINIEQQIACARREIAMRKSTYPRWVFTKKMKPGVAEYEINAMQAVHDTLTAVQKGMRCDGLPMLDDDLRYILGRPNFAVGTLAHEYRNDGAPIPHKAEDEQAFVIYRMLGFYLKSPATWRADFEADVDALIERRKAALQAAPA